jgi:hypothetical protein
MSLADHGSGSSGGGSGSPPPGPGFGAARPPTYPADPNVTPTAVTATASTPQWEEPLDEEELVGPEARRRLPWITGLLALAVVGAAAFWGGVLVQKHHDRNLVGTTTSAAAGATGGRTRGGGFGSFTGAGGGGGGATVGQVKLVDGSTIYVTDNSGNTVTIKTTDSSTFTKQTAVGLNAVAPGDTVIIRGATQSDGSISAATVTDNGPGATAGPRFGGGGSGGTGTGGTGTGATGTGAGAVGGGGGG